MVMKMNETTVTEVISNQVSQNATTITITLHPQPKSLDIVCDSEPAEIGETTLTNMSPTSGDSDSLHQAQVMVKRSLKLDLDKSDDGKEEAIKSVDSNSPNNDENLSFKSPTSPRTGNLIMSKVNQERNNHFV